MGAPHHSLFLYPQEGTIWINCTLATRIQRIVPSKIVPSPPETPTWSVLALIIHGISETFWSHETICKRYFPTTESLKSKIFACGAIWIQGNNLSLLPSYFTRYWQHTWKYLHVVWSLRNVGVGHLLQSGAQISAANNEERRLRRSAKSQSHCKTLCWEQKSSRKCPGKNVPSARKLYPRHQAWKIVPSKNCTLAQTKKKTMQSAVANFQ